MNVLELFAGSRSIGKVADVLGYNVFSSDYRPFPNIDYVVDVLEFDVMKVPFVPDIIWASPPCTTYSLAGISHHRINNRATSEEAKKADLMVLKVQEIIEYFLQFNPKMLYFVENPRGALRKMHFMTFYPIKYTVTYCQYGDSRMKPTDIFTNNNRWKPRPMCKNGDTCHESAPRGSATGTQGLPPADKSTERSAIPPELCADILLSAYEPPKRNQLKLF